MKDNSSLKYLHTNSKRDQKDHYHLGYYQKDDRNKEKPTLEKEITYFKCNKLGHYAINCLDPKESNKKANIQSTQKDYLQLATNS